MIDISEKRATLREARATAILKCDRHSIDLIQSGALPKGNPFDIARAAGLLAAKKTSDLIPHCHPVPIDHLEIQFRLDESSCSIAIETRVRSIGRTGLEMEALMAASITALTLYDVLKPVSDHLEITTIRLTHKSGGRSDPRFSTPSRLTSAVLVISDSVAAGTREDTSGRLIHEILEQQGLSVRPLQVAPDEPSRITTLIKGWVEENIDFIFTTGGTGLGPRDLTPEAIRPLLEREIPGVAEAMRTFGLERTPWGMLSRSFCGTIQRSIVVCLPGSVAGARESLLAILPGLFHARAMIAGQSHDLL